MNAPDSLGYARWCVIYLAFSTILAGCGPVNNDVKGTVTVRGKPLKDATVSFQPLTDGGKLAIGHTNEKGYYELKQPNATKGTIAGKYVVEITTFYAKDGRIVFHNWLREQREVEVGANTLDFDLFDLPP